jgi:outer membrane protein
MFRKFAFPALVMLTCGGCYPNRALIDPWSFAPHSPSRPWIPPKNVRPIELSDEPPEKLDQEEPYSLAELIDIALRNNTQTKITWAQAKSAAATYGQTQSEFLPAIGTDFYYQRARQPFFTTFIPNATSTTTATVPENPAATSVLSGTTVEDFYYSVWGPQLTVTYLIYDFGTLRATSEAARQALYNAAWTHNDAILTLLQTIMTDFYNYLYQKMLLDADKANVETANLTLEAAESGFTTGVRDVSDVLQAKTQLLQNQTTWASQQQNVETAYTTMLNDMGLPATMKLETQEMPKKLPKNDIVPPVETLIAIAMQNRPDLLASEANFRSKQQSLRAAKRQFLPKINYDFVLGKNWYNGGLEDRYNFSSTFIASMPLFRGFYYRNAIKIAEANAKAAEEQVAQSELTMIKEITTYHYNVRVAFDTLQFATAYLAAAAEQYRVALAQYKQGTNTILDVVTAQSSLVDARASQANAFQLWYTSLANLAYSTGLLSPTYLNPFHPEQIEEVVQRDVVPSQEQDTAELDESNEYEEDLAESAMSDKEFPSEISEKAKISNESNKGLSYETR